jgi:hypothetical protein
MRRMDWLAVAVAVAVAVTACGSDRARPDGAVAEPDAAAIDAYVHDVNYDFCTAADGTASITATGGGDPPATFTRTYVGGVHNTGFVTGRAPALGSTSALLMFTNAELLTFAVGACCGSSGGACCMIEGIAVQTDALDIGVELGTHGAYFRPFQDEILRMRGSVTITEFTAPWGGVPGLIAGSFSATDAGRTITGEFRNQFCAMMLSGTI